MALSLYTFVPGTKIESSPVNANFSAINAELFDLKNDNIANDAAIVDTKLAQISTADKVNGSALVSETLDAVVGAITWYIGGTLATGTGQGPILLAHCNLTIVEAYAVVRTAPTGTDLNIDINKGGVTIFSGTFTISAGATTGWTTSLSVTTLAKNDQLSLDIDQVGSTIPGADLTVVLRCEEKVPQSV